MSQAVAGSNKYRSNAARWAAVERRDRNADGAFFYGVRTTGVVCRPGCGSRRPRRDNVAFFDSVSHALAEGFRPCRRCRPGSATGEVTPAWVIDACRRLGSEDPPPNLSELAAELRVSASTLTRGFRSALGVTPSAYLQAQKAMRFRGALRNGATVTDAVYAAGYGSASRAYERAPEQLGMTPGEYRDGGDGVAIAFATARCHLGAVAVAATSRGVCAVELGGREDELAARLAQRFPNAREVTENPSLEGWMAEVLKQIETPGYLAGVPLDLQGTAFQIRVWEALRQIPVGRTLSYAQVAEQIGQPGSARAVARACATNEVAVVVPCHRVVRADGGLSGYRWGKERKQQLLDDESSVAD